MRFQTDSVPLLPAARALKTELTTEKLADTIFPYLTAVEDDKLAAQTFTMYVKNCPIVAVSGCDRRRKIPRPPKVVDLAVVRSSPQCP